MTVRLYGFWRSSATWRVRIGLNLKSLDVETIPVRLGRVEGEQHSPEHRERNPITQVPVLDVDNVHLTQSIAILEYLDEVHPNPPILPKAPLERARVRALAELVNSGIQPMHNLPVLEYVKKLGGDDQDWVRFFVGRGLDALETQAGSAFLVGDVPTIADICLVPQLAVARRFKMDADRWPRLVAIDARCNQLDAFVKARPENQPDAGTEAL